MIDITQKEFILLSCMTDMDGFMEANIPLYRDVVFEDADLGTGAGGVMASLVRKGLAWTDGKPVQKMDCHFGGSDAPECRITEKGVEVFTYHKDRQDDLRIPNPKDDPALYPQPDTKRVGKTITLSDGSTAILSIAHPVQDGDTS